MKVCSLILIVAVNIGITGCVEKNPINLSQKQYNEKEYINSKTNSTNLKQRNDKKKKGKKVLLDAPIILQNPELINGCEVTSLAMLLQYAGIKTDKMILAEEIKKDKTALIHDEKGNIKQWGNPNEGFVGDITGKKDGFGVYPKPIIELMEHYMPQRAVDLTEQPFEALTERIDSDKPVIVWVTGDFKAPNEYKEWEKNGAKIKVTFDEHAVLLVGYDKKYCYVNNPINGKKNEKIKKGAFEKTWKKMGSMAVSYR